MEWDKNFFSFFFVIHNNTIGEATLSAENSGKPLDGRGSVPNPVGGAHSALPDPLAAGEGLAALSPRTHPRCRPSASIFGPSGLIRQPLPTVFISP